MQLFSIKVREYFVVKSKLREKCLQAFCMCSGTGNEKPNPVSMHNATFRNMICNKTVSGLKIKSRGDSQNGTMSYIKFQNITLIDVDDAIMVNDYNQSGIKANDKHKIGYIEYHDITFVDIYGSFNQWIGHLDCAQQTPCYNLMFENINLKANNQNAQDKWICSANVYGTAVNVTPPLTCLG